MSVLVEFPALTFLGCTKKALDTFLISATMLKSSRFPVEYCPNISCLDGAKPYHTKHNSLAPKPQIKPTKPKSLAAKQQIKQDYPNQIRHSSRFEIFPVELNRMRKDRPFGGGIGSSIGVEVFENARNGFEEAHSACFDGIQVELLLYGVVQPLHNHRLLLELLLLLLLLLLLWLLSLVLYHSFHGSHGCSHFSVFGKQKNDQAPILHQFTGLIPLISLKFVIITPDPPPLLDKGKNSSTPVVQSSWVLLPLY